MNQQIYNRLIKNNILSLIIRLKNTYLCFINFNTLLKSPITIQSFSSISPLGSKPEEVWATYLNNETYISKTPLLSADLPQSLLDQLQTLKKENPKYKTLDKSVLMAILSSRQAFKQSGWNNAKEIGINIGSSRGATELFEAFHSDFLNAKKLSPLSSPTTTLGNLSTWVAQDLQVQGPTISHSITCSTALHAILNAIAWINSGMSTHFIAGGTEAANTPFTISQMQSLKIYSNLKKDKYPCQSLNFEKSKNTMVLGEGTAVFCLEKESDNTHSLKIKSIGYATEQINHNASISNEAVCFQLSMKQAIDGFQLTDIDAIVMHAPGTIKGDLSELKAIKSIFGKQLPALTSNKWKIGHTLGASGALSLEFAVLMLQHQKFIENPFYSNIKKPNGLKNIMVNAVGFGGNAISIVIGV
jgi:3-oxoacyl-(acyl-carrier-protein) synthase